MKNFPKILTIFFLTVFIFQLACLLFLALMPTTGQAADIKFTPQVQVSDYTFDAKDAGTGNIARYVRAIYKYAIGIVGILAAVVLMVGGVMWIVAGGNATAIGEAKSWIGASLAGLLLALLSYLILATINPALVDLKTTAIKKVEETTTGCCIYSSTAGQVAYNITNLECSNNKGSFYKDKFAQNNKCITESERVGCCVVSFKTGTISLTDNKYCYKNFKSSECSGSGSLLNLPGDAKSPSYKFDSGMNGLCSFYQQTGMVPICQSKN